MRDEITSVTSWTTINVGSPNNPPQTYNRLGWLTDWWWTEIGHEKAQSVIDSITSSYAAEGQANPLLQHPGAPGSFPPPPFGVPGTPPTPFLRLKNGLCV